VEKEGPEKTLEEAIGPKLFNQLHFQLWNLQVTPNSLRIKQNSNVLCCCCCFRIKLKQRSPSKWLGKPL
jgi:hypothetical protein